MGEPDEVEVALAGGNMGPVTRRGDRVLRTAGPWTPTTHRYLAHLRARGVPGVPEPFGLTEDGREILSFLPGVVPQYPMPHWVWRPALLRAAAGLLREIHDASLGFDRTGAHWRSPTRTPDEVICHNDFAPYNLVFAAGRLAGVIDFDFCSPGPRVWDLAYLAYRVVPLTRREVAAPFTPAEREGRLGELIDAYGQELSAERVRGVCVDRLVDLADVSDRLAVELADPALAEHAAGYRLDAEALRQDG